MTNVTALRAPKQPEEREIQLRALAALQDLLGDLSHLGMSLATTKLGEAMNPLMDTLDFTPEEVMWATERWPTKPFWQR
jgi:hypothetical protein